jgi:hypothetical protein
MKTSQYIDKEVLKSDGLQIFGSNNALAAALGMAPSTTSEWRDPLPLKLQCSIIGAVEKTGRLDELRGIVNARNVKRRQRKAA